MAKGNGNARIFKVVFTPFTKVTAKVLKGITSAAIAAAIMASASTGMSANADGILMKGTITVKDGPLGGATFESLEQLETAAKNYSPTRFMAESEEGELLISVDDDEFIVEDMGNDTPTYEVSANGMAVLKAEDVSTLVDGVSRLEAGSYELCISSQAKTVFGSFDIVATPAPKEASYMSMSASNGTGLYRKFSSAGETQWVLMDETLRTLVPELEAAGHNPACYLEHVFLVDGVETMTLDLNQDNAVSVADFVVSKRYSELGAYEFDSIAEDIMQELGVPHSSNF